MNCQLLSSVPLHSHRLCERTDTDTERSLYIALIHLQDQRRFYRNIFHQTDDLIRKIGIMAAAKAYDLHIFQIVFFCCQNSRGKHSGMKIIYNIQPAFL